MHSRTWLAFSSAFVTATGAVACQSGRSEPPGTIAMPSTPSSADAAPASAPASVSLAVRAGWRWRNHATPEQEDRELRHVRLAGGDEVVVARGERGAVSIARVDARGARRWTAALTAREDDATLVLRGDAILAAVFSSAANGCSVVSLDATTGAQRWRNELHGIGRVGHEKYRNQVQAQILDGHLVVYGHESFGSYVEVVDPSTGRSLASHRPAEDS